MTLDEYQKKSRVTARYPNIDNNLTYPIIGLMGEAGEMANKFKKTMRDDGGQLSEDIRHDLAKELGDVLWYVAAIASELNIKLDTIASDNIEKLYSRMERGTIGGSGDER